MKLLILMSILSFIVVAIVITTITLVLYFLRKKKLKKREVLFTKIKPGSVVEFTVNNNGRINIFKGKVHFIDEKNEMASIKTRRKVYVVLFDDVKKIIHEAV